MLFVSGSGLVEDDAFEAFITMVFTSPLLFSCKISSPKEVYHTRSVAVIPAPVRVPTQRPLVPSFT